MTIFFYGMKILEWKILTRYGTPKPAGNNAPSAAVNSSSSPAEKPANHSAEARQTPAVPAGVRATNNYPRVDGLNTGNFITDRPSTKVHAAPGGGSSLGYLFGGGSDK